MSKLSSYQRYDIFLRNNTGINKLLPANKLDTYGVWEVVGETTDGYGPGRRIGFLEGTLEDVIQYAVRHPDFYSYGSGGDIRKVEVRKVNAETAIQEEALREEVAEMERKLAALRGQLPKSTY